MSTEDARAAAHRKLGNTTLIKEDTRAAWGFLWLERLWQDIHHAARMFTKNPGFTAVAVLSIAIGVGANCAMFSVADALLLRPLPVVQPSEIVTVGSVNSLTNSLGLSQLQMSYPDYLDLRERATSFSSAVASTIVRVGVATQQEDAQKLTMVAPVSGNFFRDLGVEPALGRSFLAEEDQVPGRDAVAVIDDDVWHSQYAADPAVLGRKLWFSGQEFTIIGVAPKSFTGMNPFVHPGYYVPLAMWPSLLRNSATDPLKTRSRRDLSVKARLKPGVSMARAQEEVAAVAANLQAAYPDTNQNQSFVTRTELQARFAQDQGDSSMAATLLSLSIAVLLVACANVAGLLSSREPVRAREIAMRMAIGASRPRLIRQLLTEGLLIALAGGALGLGLGYAGVDLFRNIQIPSDLPIRIEVHLDQRALLASLAIALFSVVLFALIPAFRTTRSDLTSVMKASGAASGPRRLWGRNLLVSGQVAIALVLLTISTFAYRTFSRNLSANPGFRTDHLLVMGFDPSLAGYSEPRTQAFYKNLLERARTTPGVKSVALASNIPLTIDLDFASILPEGFTLPDGQQAVNLMANRIDEHYLDTMGVRLLSGRDFRETDDASSPQVAIVNQQVAQHYWPGQSAVGKRFRLNDAKGKWVEIVGVAVTSKYTFIAEPPSEFVYLPWRQLPRDHMYLVAESAGPPAGLAAPLREVVRRLDTSQPVYNVRTMDEVFEIRAVKLAQVLTRTIGSMGFMGLVLAVIGLYGLVAYSVSRRTREIGIRIAIGARRGEILRMILRRGLILSLSGIAVGLIASMATGQMLQSIFPDLTTSSNLTVSVLVALSLLAVTMLAAYIPARRASKVDPNVALRQE
jgi:predicted permease